MILSLFEGQCMKYRLFARAYSFWFTVLTIRQDMMDQTDGNTDKQIKVP